MSDVRVVLSLAARATTWRSGTFLSRIQNLIFLSFGESIEVVTSVTVIGRMDQVIWMSACEATNNATQNFIRDGSSNSASLFDYCVIFFTIHCRLIFWVIAKK